MNELLNDLLNQNQARTCEVCGSDWWRILHEGDESNCDCVGAECLRVCAEDECAGIATIN
jgi:hypothetical protein